MPYSGGKPNEFCWTRLMTQDVNEAKRFYNKLFGWELHKSNLGELALYMFKNGDKEIGGLIETPIGFEDTYSPHWLSYIAVEDINLTIEKAVALGAKVFLPVKEIGTNGYISVLVDPTGARIGIWQASNAIY